MNMASVNQVTIIGNLTRDPESRNLPSGAMVCNFTVATSDRWNDKATGKVQEKSEFHNVVTFGKLAEICSQYLAKGKQIYLSGKLETDSYEKDGVKRYSTKIKANTVQFLGGKSEQGEQSKSSKDYKPSQDNSFDLDSIPF